MNNSHRAPKAENSRARTVKADRARSCYPFAAIVGQEEMKLALILNVIDPTVGGVLLMGHRGTGKSTVVRALADLLPQTSVIAGCPYGCDPQEASTFCDECSGASESNPTLKVRKRAVQVVELPLGATEDRVCGTIDIEQALGSGLKRFEPGLLARANRGFLYIDEVNLLEDHLVDLLLDVAATGVNKVERESLSVQHPARFVLIGSGNPEEGELRPQLLDRFGLYIEIRTEGELDRRVEIVERRDAFERDSIAFREMFAIEQEQLRKQISRSRKSIGQVQVERQLLRNIAGLCSDLKVDGHRGELTIMRAARALASFEGRKTVSEQDVKRVAVMALRHRLRRDSLEEAASVEQIQQALDKAFAKTGGTSRGGGAGDGDGSSANVFSAKQMQASRSSPQGGTRSVSPNGKLGADTQARTVTSPAAEKCLPTRFGKPEARAGRSAGWRSRQARESKSTTTVYDHQRGRYARSVISSRGSTRIAIDATLRALVASTSLAGTASLNSSFTPVPADAWRFKLFKRKQGRLFIFAVDLSGSMALNRIAQAKGTMLALLRQSYVKRDTVAMIGFRGKSAEVLLLPSRSILRARRVLDSMTMGGGTPLAAGLASALELAKRESQKVGETTLLLFTDGQANVALSEMETDDRTKRQEIIRTEITRLGDQIRKAGVTPIVIDTQNDFRSGGKAQALAEMLGAQYRRLTLENSVAPLSTSRFNRRPA